MDAAPGVRGHDARLEHVGGRGEDGGQRARQAAQRHRLPARQLARLPVRAACKAAQGWQCGKESSLVRVPVRAACKERGVDSGRCSELSYKARG